jgi:hypothetical protein
MTANSLFEPDDKSAVCVGLVGLVYQRLVSVEAVAEDVQDYNIPHRVVRS